MFINETLNTRITKTCDVLVCGGGFAYVSAAMTDDFTTLDIATLQTSWQRQA